MLHDVSAEVEPRFVNKKEASKNGTKADILEDAGYRFPAHWRNPHQRPFIGWDGEGITYPGDVEQSYVLFGASTGDRISKHSLGTTDCFNLLLSVEAANPDAIHVGFAIQYDSNMLFRDLPRRHLERLYRTNKCWWEGYRIEYRPGKWLSIRHNNTRVRLFDVFGFFQSSFVVACEKFLGKDDPELVGIREGKAARQSFAYDQLDTFIVPYWEGELRLLVRLMDSLRDDLTTAGLKVASWHGPGAVANTVFRLNNIGAVKGKTPPEVNRAAQFAYAGGRFELFKAGHHPDTVWEYDINSAYPSAIADLPDLSKGSWEYASTFQPDSFGVWQTSLDTKTHPIASWFAPNPLFCRDRHGNVSYPPLVEGWYWTPEASLVASSVKGGWIFKHDGSKPFAFVHEMYEKRLEWKQNGNSAEKALKLALNSLYGKMAQRAGWLEEGDPIPRWHQLEWAGYVTSATRAKLYRDAISLAKGSLLAVETDAIFVTASIPSLPIGTKLGEWTETTFDWITYLQNGLYFAGQNGEIVERYRGFDKGSISHGTVMEALSEVRKGRVTNLTGTTTRFVGMGLGLHTKARWRSWQTDQRNIVIGGGGKRVHIPGLCSMCKNSVPFSEQLHPLAIVTPGGRSEPHSLPWLASREPELRKLDDLAKW